MSAHGLLDDLLDQHRSTVALGSPENPVPPPAGVSLLRRAQRDCRPTRHPNRTEGATHMTKRESLQDRVNRGAEWLDAVRPEWWTEIDVATLDLGNGCRCVLGQVVGSDPSSRWSGYGMVSIVANEAFGDVGATDWSVEHGFLGVTHKECAALDELWIAQIKARWSGEQVA